jgi:hypothetical protein
LPALSDDVAQLGGELLAIVLDLGRRANTEAPARPYYTQRGKEAEKRQREGSPCSGNNTQERRVGDL